MKEYVLCRICCRRYRGYAPKGGDGSVLYPRTHQRQIPTWRRDAKVLKKEICPGSFFEGEIITGLCAEPSENAKDK